jgi:hypothetical protein
LETAWESQERDILGNLFHSLTGKIEQFVKRLIYKVETAWESQEKYLTANLLHSITGEHEQFVKQLIWKVETAWESQERNILATYCIALAVSMSTLQTADTRINTGEESREISWATYFTA